MRGSYGAGRARIRKIALCAATATLALTLILSPAAGAQTPAPQTTLPDVEDEVMCVVCGVTLELASDSKQAIDERNLIRDLIAQGFTKDQIKDRLVAEFGEEVLAEPSTEGFDLAAWLVPGLAVVAAAIAIFLGLRRWRTAGVDAASADAPVSAESTEDRERLDADLKRYGL